MMTERAGQVISDLQYVAAEAEAAFSPLSALQLNWKPAAGSWSVAQCLDHMIKTNNEMLPAIDAKINGGKSSFWENLSPLTGFFGGYLSKSMRSDAKRFKAPSRSIVPPSEIEADIVEQFSGNQKAVSEKVRSMDVLDWDKTVMTSPFVGLMTYCVSDGIVVLVEHEKRHIRQAKRVMETEGFPK